MTDTIRSPKQPNIRRTRTTCPSRACGPGLLSSLQDWKPRLLVTTISRSFELVPLVAALFNPDYVLAFVTEEINTNAVSDSENTSVAGFVRNAHEQGRFPGIFDTFELPEELTPDASKTIQTGIQTKARRIENESGCAVQPHEILYDLTPGQVFFALTYLDIAKPHSRIIYLRSPTNENNRVIPGSEQPHFLEVKTRGELTPLYRDSVSF